MIILEEKYPLNQKLTLSGYLYRIRVLIKSHWLKLLLPVFVWLFFSWSNIIPSSFKPSEHISINFYWTIIWTLTDHYTNNYSQVTRDNAKESKLYDINKNLIQRGEINKAIQITLMALLRSDYHLWLTLLSYLILTWSFIITNFDRQILILLVTLQIIASYQPQTSFKSKIIWFFWAIWSLISNTISESWNKIKTSILIVWIITFLLYRFHSLALIWFSYTLLAWALFFSWLDYLVIFLLISFQTLIIYQILTKYSYNRKDLLYLINKSWNKILSLSIKKTWECFKFPILTLFIIFTIIIIRASNPGLMKQWLESAYRVSSWLIWFVGLTWVYWVYIMITRWWFFEIECIADKENDWFKPYELARTLIISHTTRHMFCILFWGLGLILYLYNKISPSTRVWEFASYVIISFGVTLLLIINWIRYTNLKEMFLNWQWKDEKMKRFFETLVWIK